jgi:hypothetical protein
VAERGWKMWGQGEKLGMGVWRRSAFFRILLADHTSGQG